MAFVDQNLKCVDCGTEFVFSADEQVFFQTRQFVNVPKRCKQCRSRRFGGMRFRTETRIACAACGAETSVPFKPNQGRPVLCRVCFQRGGLHLVRDSQVGHGD